LTNFDQNGRKNAIKFWEKWIYSNWNGSLMRILPLAYYFYYKPTDKDIMLDTIKWVSSITHSHEISFLWCYIYVLYVINILEGSSKEEAYKKLWEENYKYYFSEETIEIYKRILDWKLEFLNLDEIKSWGYVIDTLEAVLWVILTTKNYKEAIIKAINLWGDTDTIWALSGWIAGIIYGYESIPKDWLTDMKRLDYLEEMSENLENIYLLKDVWILSKNQFFN
jgi:ADP-ribosylglycohydrolase